MAIPRRVLLAAALFVPAGVQLRAEARPNFTGTWKLNEKLSGNSDVREIVWVIEHKEPKFQYTASGRRGFMPFSESHEFTMDGKMPTAGIAGAWEGQALILKYLKDGKEAMRFVFRVSADGKQMTREADLGGNRKVREVYDRQ